MPLRRGTFLYGQVLKDRKTPKTHQTQYEIYGKIFFRFDTVCGNCILIFLRTPFPVFVKTYPKAVEIKSIMPNTMVFQEKLRRPKDI